MPALPLHKVPLWLGFSAWDRDPHSQNTFAGDTAAGRGWQWMGKRQMSPRPELVAAWGGGSTVGRVT